MTAPALRDGIGTGINKNVVKALHVREVLGDTYNQQQSNSGGGGGFGFDDEAKAGKAGKGGKVGKARADAAAKAKAAAERKMRLLAPPYVEEVLGVHYSPEFDQLVLVASNGYVRVWSMDLAEPEFLFQASAAAPPGPLVAAHLA